MHQAWTELVEVLADRPHRWAACRDLGRYHQNDNDLDAMLVVVDHLSGLGRLVAGLLAVKLVAAGGFATGWARPWTDRSALLRADPDPDVREAARAIRGRMFTTRQGTTR